MYEKNHGGGGVAVQNNNGGGGGDRGKNNDQRAMEARYLVSETSFGVQKRRKRMVRFPPEALHQLFTFGSSSSSSTITTTSSLASPPSAVAAPTMDQRKLWFLFEKGLKNSDVSPLRRMVLHKKSAEAHLPMLDRRKASLSAWPRHISHVWNFTYRFWPNNNSRMYVLENTRDSVNTHGLQQGDSVVVYQNDQTRNFKAGEGEDACNKTSKNAIDDIQIEEYPEVNEIDSFNMIFPAMDEDMGMLLVYDTISSNYSPLDFLGGCMTNYTRIAPSETFTSVDNYCSDDFS